MASLGAKIFSLILRGFGAKQRLLRAASSPPRSRGKFVPKLFARSKRVEATTLENGAIATLDYSEKAKLSRQLSNFSATTHIFFLHGGAYVLESSLIHWFFVNQIAKRLSCRATLLDYPLAPEHSYRDTVAMLRQTYDQLVSQYPQDNFVLMGDSAGGGLALAFAQMLVQENHPHLPVRNVLLSPWLDLTMSNPKVRDIEPLDHMLTVEFLHRCGGKYAGGDDPSQPLLSPINGSLAGLPRTAVFYGSHELFWPDCEALKAKCEAAGAAFEFYEYKEMRVQGNAAHLVFVSHARTTEGH